MTLPPVHGRGFTVDRGKGPDTPPGPRSVPLAGLIATAVVVSGLALIVVGVWIGAGWPWGLVAAGAALITIERWPDPKEPSP